VVGYDVSADVAVLKLEHASALQAIPIGRSASAKPGDAVAAIGNAGGDGGAPKRTTGEIVALDQSISALDDDGNLERLAGLIEMSAPLTPGDSGGPLVDGSGKVIGMDTAGSPHFAFRQSSNDGFAIPIDRVLSIASRIEHGRSSAEIHVGPTAFIGVNIQSPGHEEGSRAVGALVTGIVTGDIIYAVKGRTIAGPSALTSALASLSPGVTVRLAWIDQAGKTHRASVRLGNGPPQ
jgi:S1-C subfamily serine protease